MLLISVDDITPSRVVLLLSFFFLVFNDFKKKKVSSSECFLAYAPFHFLELITVVS